MERDLLLAEGLNAAFLGIGLREGQPDVAVYSIQRALAVYITHGMTESEARCLKRKPVNTWIGCM